MSGTSTTGCEPKDSDRRHNARVRRRVYHWTEGKNPSLVERAPTKPRSKFKAGAHVVGIDLSVRAAAACAIPIPWDYDLGKIKMVRAGYALEKGATNRDKIERGNQIAHDISVFCVNVRAMRIAIEEYAYAMKSANIHQVIECGGMVKADILNTLDLDVYPVQASAARKILLQHVPGKMGQGKTKPWVIKNVKRLGGPTLAWTEDECDAFVVANTVLEHAGAVALSFPGE